MVLSKDKEFKKLMKGFEYGGGGKTLENGKILDEDWLLESHSMNEKEFTEKINILDNYIKYGDKDLKLDWLYSHYPNIEYGLYDSNYKKDEKNRKEIQSKGYQGKFSHSRPFWEI